MLTSNDSPDVRIIGADRHLLRIARREIGMTEAKVQGRIKVEDEKGKFENLVALVDEMEGASNNK